MKVSELMVTQVVTCRPHDSLAGAVGRMLEHDSGCLPVVDAEGRVDAVITDRDIAIAGMLNGLPLGDIRVADTMSRELVSCTPVESIAEAAQRMAAKQVRRLPVVDADRRLVGIISLNDIAVALSPKALAPIKDEAALATLRALMGVCQHRTALPAAAPPGLTPAPVTPPEKGPTKT